MSKRTGIVFGSVIASAVVGCSLIIDVPGVVDNTTRDVAGAAGSSMESNNGTAGAAGDSTGLAGGTAGVAGE